jgi:septal ring factor EnvC (AmiA/AmiB activator)
MIHPGVGEALESIVAAVENDIAPKVEDEYAASMCRTVAQMLRSVRVRIAEEPAALAADNAELRELLAAHADRSPDRERLDTAVRTSAERRRPTLDELYADAEALRSALSALIEAVPDSTDPARKAAREYLRHSLDRERPWMVDAFTGPRR